MKYCITLQPLEPYMFGGELTFGKHGDKEAGSYMVKSRLFPQQTAILGMIRKVYLMQKGLLTRKRRGEWVDKHNHAEACKLVGIGKFDMLSQEGIDLGAIRQIGPVHLVKNGVSVIKKADIDTHPYHDGILKDYAPKKDIFDNYIATTGTEQYSSEDIFEPVEQVGNKKGGEQNSLFKKTAYRLKEGFGFAFTLESEEPLENDIVTLGADQSAFSMHVEPLQDDPLDYRDTNGYVVLLSDSYITLPIREHCKFALTSEISHRNLKGKKSVLRGKENGLEKSQTLYLYEKGSLFIEPEKTLLDNLNNKHLQKIGYNIYTQGEKK